jgi:CheY-like chemotaxis protein
VIIFLIDDDAEEAELFNEAIQSIDDNIFVEAYSNGRDALKALHEAEQKPNLIFLDLNMPMFSGKEVLKALRSDPVTSSLPVVIYSTTISRRDVEDTEPYQVKAYLQKPEDFASLRQKLSDQLVQA